MLALALGRKPSSADCVRTSPPPEAVQGDPCWSHTPGRERPLPKYTYGIEARGVSVGSGSSGCQAGSTLSSCVHSQALSTVTA